MNLYFRLLALIVKWCFSKKELKPLAQAQTRFTVWPFDLDINLHVNNGRYLTLMDLGRMDLMIKINLWKTILKNRWMPVLGGAKIHYIRPLDPFKRFTLTTEVVYWDEKWIYLKQQFIYQEKVMAVAFVKALFLKKREKIKPDVILQSLDHKVQKPIPPTELMEWIKNHPDLSTQSVQRTGV